MAGLGNALGKFSSACPGRGKFILIVFQRNRSAKDRVSQVVRKVFKCMPRSWKIYFDRFSEKSFSKRPSFASGHEPDF